MGKRDETEMGRDPRKMRKCGALRISEEPKDDKAVGGAIFPGLKSCQVPALWKTSQITQNKAKKYFAELGINSLNLPYLK